MKKTPPVRARSAPSAFHAEEFRRAVGVAYVPALAAPADWSDDGRADSWCDKNERALGAARVASLSALLDRPPAPPCRIEDAGPGAGRGLFAERPLSAGMFIGEYAGALTRDWAPLSAGGRFNPYLLKYPFPCAWAIDAEACGNELRFANHSAKAANAQRVFLRRGGLVRALIVARVAIAEGAQILLDYGPDYRFASPPQELAP